MNGICDECCEEFTEELSKAQSSRKDLKDYIFKQIQKEIKANNKAKDLRTISCLGRFVHKLPKVMILRCGIHSTQPGHSPRKGPRNTHLVTSWPDLFWYCLPELTWRAEPTARILLSLSVPPWRKQKMLHLGMQSAHLSWLCRCTVLLSVDTMLRPMRTMRVWRTKALGSTLTSLCPLIC